MTVVILKRTGRNAECHIADDDPLVEADLYELAYVSHTTSNMFGNARAPKLTLWFRIMDYGEFNGIILPRHYNIKNHVGRKGKYGDFKVGKKSDFLHEYLNVFPTASIIRLDRIPMTPLENVIIRGRVRTVTTDYKQRKKHQQTQYSVIAELIGQKQI